MLGGEVKERPLVLISLPGSNQPDCEFRVVAGSRTPPILQNILFAIKVRGKRGGSPATGLKDDTWFYAGWIRTVKVGDVVQFYRHFPSYLYPDLLAMIEQYTK